MAEQLLHRLPDRDLEAALRGLAPSIAWPVATLPDGTDIAASVRARLEAGAISDAPSSAATSVLPPPVRWRPSGLGWFRPARRALVLALLAMVALAAIAGAAILGLPGIRITLGPVPATPEPTMSPSASPTPPGTPAPLGSRMSIGRPLDVTNDAAIDEAAGFDVLWPEDPDLGVPDAVYFDPIKGGQVTFLWATSDELPATHEPAVGLLMSQFVGDVDDGFFRKVADGGTPVEPVAVNGRAAYWISGDPHVFFWTGADGFVDDPRRWVGDVLLWDDGPITYRLETSLGREQAIRIAESVPLR
jgi:hypothetical protein